MTDLGDLFDEYALRARIYPSLLASLPIPVTVLLVWPDPGLRALWPIAVGVGVVFFLANFTRSRGQRLERTLVEKWNGLPTTHMLRHSEVDNPVMFRRRRERLEAVFGEALPTAEEETANPTAADAAYVAATRSLIAKVRADTKRFNRVHEENIHYGFRRNLLALKTIGLTLLAVLSLADVIVIALHFRSATLTALGIDLILALAWLRVVNADWVRQAGQTYAERLFEALEQGDVQSA
jgi:hypothetical protein